MTLADKIRKLLQASPGISNREVAHHFGCRPSYVRAVKQRFNGQSKADRKYRQKVMPHGDAELATNLAREAYAVARSKGASWREASKVSAIIRNRVMWTSGIAALRVQK